MPRFFRRLAEGVFDIEDLKFRTYELADFVQQASKVYGFDLEHLVAEGYSNGANIATSELLLRPAIFLSYFVSSYGAACTRCNARPFDQTCIHFCWIT
jgi:predicted esterase